MITEKPRQEFKIDYPIDVVKHSINESLRIPKYVVYKKDDVLNYYRFGITRMLNTGILNITVRKIDDKTTNCLFEMENNPGGVTPVSVLSSMMNEYLTLFSDLVSGKQKVGIVVMTKAERRKTWIKLILLVVLAISLWIAIYYFDHRPMVAPKTYTP